MTENDVRAIALFFFYALLDDQKAIEAGARALNLAKDKKRRDPKLGNPVALVAATFEIWQKEEAEARRMSMVRSLSAWALPDGTDLGPWREFHRQASSEEIVVVIWSKILGISDHDIAEALDLPEGTVRYRVGHALRKLGEFTSSRPKII